MIPRYSLPAMAAIWTDKARLDRWLEIEILATEAWASLGVVPMEDAQEVRKRAAFTVEAVDAREQITDHDVAAFVDVVQESVGGTAGKWVHYGLTSSDVVDTALAWAMRDAANLLIESISTLITTVVSRAREFAETPCMGRTHGIHAEPTTFGAKIALWALQLDRDRTRLLRARDTIAVGKLSGAVGTYSNIDPAVEVAVCRALGLEPVPATQVLARDRHAEFLYACASVGATIELIGTEIRHLQRTEVREVREPFRAGQKGSSAMPHKRNPITAERLSGLARILRGNLGAGLENVALWHERDISHSSVERVILPDTALLAHYVMVTANRMVAGMTVDADQMLTNIDASFGLVFSQSVLLALVSGGLTRDDAYRVVQENALRAWDERRNFRDLINADARVTGTVAASVLDEAFDLQRVLRNAGRAISALDALSTR
jgi:adenylosuccinate lyase